MTATATGGSDFLNDDAWRTIFGYMDIQSLLNCESTCKTWTSIIRGLAEGEDADSKLQDDKKKGRRDVSCVWGTLYCTLWRKPQRQGGGDNVVQGRHRRFLLPPDFVRSNHYWKIMCRQRYVELNKSMDSISTHATTTLKKLEGSISRSTNIVVKNNRNLDTNFLGIYGIQSVRFEDELQPLWFTEDFLGMDLCYFEAHVQGGASVGIVSIANNELKECYGRGSRKHIGWDGISYGFHSDDGDIFWNDGNDPFGGRNVTFGTPWGDSSVIGCGYDRVGSKLFFTVDGQFIGEFNAASIPKSRYSAAVTLHEYDDSATINFGSAPFLFDIEMYCYCIRHGK